MLDTIVKIVGVLAVGYVAVVAVTYIFQRKLIYHPSIEIPSLQDADLAGARAVVLRPDDGLELTAWYAPAAPARPTLVYFHGNAGHIGHRADKVRPYIDAGYGVLLVQYRGFGGNPGRPTEAGLYRDAAAALAFIGETVAPRDLIIYGESLGSGVAVEIARDRQIRALVLDAPFTSLPDAGARVYPYLPVRWLTRDRFDSLSKIADVHAPLIVVHGERDAVVPVALGRRLLDAANPPKRGIFFPNGGHADIDPATSAKQVLAALAELTSESP